MTLIHIKKYFYRLKKLIVKMKIAYSNTKECKSFPSLSSSKRNAYKHLKDIQNCIETAHGKCSHIIALLSMIHYKEPLL